MTLYNNPDYLIDNYVASHKPNGRKTGGNEIGRKKRENSRTSMELLFLLSALVACSAHLASGGKRGEKGKKSSSNRFHVAMGRLKVKIVVVGSPRGKYGQNDVKNYKFLIGISISKLIKLIKTMVLITLALIQTILPTFFFIGM